MQFLKYHVLFSIAMAAWPLNSLAEGISGFQDFEFGMKLEELQANYSLTPGSPTDAGREYKADSIKILGDEYKQTLMFDKDNKLIQVNVHRVFSGDDTACTLEFNEIFGAIQARYGEPDQPPERTVHGGISAITGARFTETDGSRVNLSATWLNDCYMNVAYVSGPGGSGF